MLVHLDRRSAIEWRAWSAAAFTAAREMHRGVLLLLTVPWSEACAALDEELEADPTLCAHLGASFVLLRVDAERRPDIADRYDAGGWPAAFFLTPCGDTLTAVRGGARHIAERAEQVATAAARMEATSAAAGASVLRPSNDPVRGSALVDWFVQLSLSEYDSQHGGFGRAEKFPHADVLRVLVGALPTHPQVGDPLMHSLRALEHLRDPGDGGFYRMAIGRDWSDRSSEKLLADQAAILRLYLTAARGLDDARLLEHAAGVADFTTRYLAHTEGGFCGSVRGRKVDRTLYLDANAAMTTALLETAAASSDEVLARTCVTGLERLLLAAFRPAQGVAHWISGCDIGAERLLIDQVAVAEAMLTAYELGGDPTHVMLAEELLLFAVRTLWDEDACAFRDRIPQPEDLGPVRRPVHPFLANVDAARVLTRLEGATGNDAYGRRATSLLASLASRCLEHGLLAARYISAIRMIC